jgi:copper oxidase (laccase) domain-containing protein
LLLRDPRGRREPFRARFGREIVRDGRLDLWSATERELRAAGCDDVERVDLCTFCHPQLFFSHRRDRGVTGRQGAIGYVT